jgi:hypothetical protein
VCVPHSAELVAAENDYHSRGGVIAVKLCDDPWYHLVRDAVREEVAARLGVPGRDLEVEFYPTKGFFVLLPSSSFRDQVLAESAGLSVGQAKLQFLPWTRMAGAVKSKLSFKVRLCIEGIPLHARWANIIRKLLPQDSLFECIDRNSHSDNEANCCCVTVWSRDPNNILKEAALHLEELQDRPTAAWHSADPASTDGRRQRAGPVKMLRFETIIHVDQIVDFRPPTTSSAEWPVRHSFRWRLGYRDDWSRPPLRRTVQGRRGPGKRDRSPSVGGGAEGAGGRASNPSQFDAGGRNARRLGPSTNGPR